MRLPPLETASLRVFSFFFSLSSPRMKAEIKQLEEEVKVTPVFSFFFFSLCVCCCCCCCFAFPLTSDPEVQLQRGPIKAEPAHVCVNPREKRDSKAHRGKKTCVATIKMSRNKGREENKKKEFKKKKPLTKLPLRQQNKRRKPPHACDGGNNNTTTTIKKKRKKAKHNQKTSDTSNNTAVNWPLSSVFFSSFSPFFSSRGCGIDGS